MAAETKIEWCHATFNCWRGCTKVSAGCANCYAETLSGRNPKTLGVWGPSGTRVVAAESQWREPVKWDKAAAAKGERHRVFCASLADVFEDWDGPMVDSQGRRLMLNASTTEPYYEPFDETKPFYTWASMQTIRKRLFRLIENTPHLDWLLLTKRPENVLRMTYDAWCHKVPSHVSQNEGDGRRWSWPANVWLGTSVENQAAADERIPHLLNVPAAVRFLASEPLLGPVDLRPKAPDAYAILGRFYGTGTFDPAGMSPAADRVLNCFPRIDWVIVGGESGPGARPMRVEWARSLVEQCKAAGVACFVKQLGAQPHDCSDGSDRPNAGTLLTLADRKGGDIEEFPADLRIREFPEPQAKGA